MSTIVNLDRIAAQYAQKIVNEDVKVKDLENQVTKSLGVLQEQGIYALMLLLFSQDSKETKAIYKHLIELLKNIGLKNIEEETWPQKNEKNQYNFQRVLKFYSDNILKDIERLFLVRDIYEQTLIYARYGAKASGKTEKPQKDSKTDTSTGS
ncbi:MAG: hypothetical protein GXY49_00255 [Syntrophomonadaceae bacterium]|nr:hypothetical protein [Syntrophomonadaceae bacterium]